MDTVTVNIYGENYTVKAGEDPGYIDTVARFVDGKMREIFADVKVVTTSKIAILTALNIADELFKCRRDLEEGQEEAVSRKIEELLKVLQKAIRE